MCWQCWLLISYYNLWCMQKKNIVYFVVFFFELLTAVYLSKIIYIFRMIWLDWYTRIQITQNNISSKRNCCAFFFNIIIPFILLILTHILINEWCFLQQIMARDLLVLICMMTFTSFSLHIWFSARFDRNFFFFQIFLQRKKWKKKKFKSVCANLFFFSHFFVLRVVFSLLHLPNRKNN